MGIYIKNMCKPKCCIECPFCHGSIYGGKCTIVADIYRESGEDLCLPDCEIQDWCPLIELDDEEVDILKKKEEWIYD